MKVQVKPLAVRLEPKSRKPQPFRWTRKQYYRMLETGVLEEGAKVELINGEITSAGMVDRMTQHRIHSLAIRRVAKALQRVFNDGFDIQQQLPLSLAGGSEPEPDVSVIVGDAEDYVDQHPDHAVLVVEVAERSLGYDRRSKSSLYASAGIPEYWIVNLPQKCLEVHRNPQPVSNNPSQAKYQDQVVLRAGESIHPVANPDATVVVEDLLP